MPSGMVPSADKTQPRRGESPLELPLRPNQAATPYRAQAATTSASGASAVRTGAWPGKSSSETPAPSTTAATA